MCRSKKLLAGLAMLVVCTFIAPDAHSQITSEENAVKAAFVFNILKFINWTKPLASGGANIVVCMWGQDTLGGALDALNRKEAENRAIKVSYVPQGVRPVSCDVIYVGNGVNDEAKEYEQALTSPKTLTISDHEGFIENGGLIEFYRSSDRVRFRINESLIEAKDYEIGSRLLEFAR